MWTAKASSPHSVDKSERDVGHQEYDDGEDGSVRVYDEDEVVYIDHLLGVPWAGVVRLWTVVWTGFSVHRTYWLTVSINLP